MPKSVGKKRGSKNAVDEARQIYESIAKLARIGCTDSEIAAAMGVEQSVYDLRMQRDRPFRELIQRNRASGAMSLRAMQWKSARAGSVRMQAWLGKQMLGQSERNELRVSTGSGDMVDLDLSALSDGELDVLQALLAKAKKRHETDEIIDICGSDNLLIGEGREDTRREVFGEDNETRNDEDIDPCQAEKERSGARKKV